MLPSASGRNLSLPCSRSLLHQLSSSRMSWPKLKPPATLAFWRLRSKTNKCVPFLNWSHLFLIASRRGEEQKIMTAINQACRGKCTLMRLERKTPAKSCLVCPVNFHPCLVRKTLQAASQVCSQGRELGSGWLNCSGCGLPCTFWDLRQGRERWQGVGSGGFYQDTGCVGGSRGAWEQGLWALGSSRVVVEAAVAHIIDSGAHSLFYCLNKPPVRASW